MTWPDPEALKRAKADFPRVNPANPTELSDDEWEREVAAGARMWTTVGPEIARRFEQVIQDALPPSELARSGRHCREVENWFTRELDRLLYVPRLASGRADEARTAVRLSRMARKLKGEEAGRFPKGARGWLLMLAGKYRELQGRYYIFKPLPEASKAAWEKCEKEAGEHEDAEARRICETVSKGIPEWITDFIVEVLFVLVRLDGKRDRVVRLRNVHGEVTKVLRWPAEEFGSPKPMRIWLNNNANCANWAAGERELNHLGMDIGQAVSGKEVLEVPLRGFHYPSGLYFFEDCALGPGGLVLRKDVNGVYWYQGKGYLLSDTDPEGQEFRQGPKPQLPGPFMHPLATATPGEVRIIFQHFADDVFDCVGGYAGWLALGVVLSLGAAREIFERYTAFAGLWVFGESGHGKSSLVRWLMRVWGFMVKVGVPLPGSSQASLRGALQQYGDLALWLEEFQPNCERWVVDLLKAVYDRGGSIKKTFDEVVRVIRSGVIVTGVATTTDSQLRGRYCHVQVCKERRINFDQERYQRVEKWSAEFYKIGRFIIAHREEFARLVVDQMTHWINDPKLADCDERSRIVHGAAYGAFAALATLLESHGADQLREFREFLRGYIEGAQQDVRDQLYVSQFFQDLLSAEKAGFFGETASDLRRYFKAVDKDEATADWGVSPRQRQLGQESRFCRWPGKYLYIAAKDTVERVMAYRRTLGPAASEGNLSRKDLYDQMKGRPYVVPPPKGRSSHQIRFEGGGQEVAWCIDLDQHDMGLQPVSDQDFETSLRKADGNFVISTEWQDPRKGPLFVLVDRLARQQPTLDK
ncbi:MAG TPA: hypothetical protein VN829_16030 [Dongiaceae bacterium]|nr:hypothetical protein [Dongiaceae bacterium]